MVAAYTVPDTQALTVAELATVPRTHLRAIISIG
jgi:hypothetical protein